MRSKWKKSALALFSGAVLMLAACGSNSAAPEKEEKKDEPAQQEEAKTYNIGVTQIVEHPSLNAAFDGFKAALEDAGIKAEYDVQIAQGDNSANTSIANNLVSGGVDLIFANSTPSAQAAASATSDIPIIFTSVTDAEGAELVDSNEKPGGNVTGTVDTHPDAIPSTLKFLKDDLGAKKVGMVFNSGEQNSRAQVDSIKKLIKDEGLGLEIVEASVATSADVKQAAESLVGKVDSMYTITDNTVVSALESVVSVANDNKLPMMVGEFDSVDRGGLGAYGFEYYDIGYEAGEMAVKILKGEGEPAEMPVQYPQNLKFVINKDTAEAIGLEIKDDWNAEDVKDLEK
ncbi:ABC transporter substrate-binding protein [Siminovitchia acidinfaciens]|uniref:ABC transporter substrate-binding protein n=1 Tax=Siminovitchia acidinfaciens TaxID=2321395 RepID=A0A429Y1R3_9BACI|nr:ABC transporter substrate-binding protein [Siminovitchia acidinfaciens]RST75106.1 ABC transporter substrate-binding protein [Siminovitchia acidinfaciens]